MGQKLGFEGWKQLLKIDCIARGKKREFESLTDSVLKILYDSGLDPTVHAIATDDGQTQK